MSNTWILIADRCDARVFEVIQGGDLRLLHHLEHPEGRLQDRDMGSGRPGNVMKPAQGAFHAMGQEQFPHDHITEQWAQQLARLLHDARSQNAFDRLILAAEPGFLGVLRAQLHGPTLALVVATVAKKLTQVPVHALPAYLGQALQHGATHAGR